MDRQMASFVGLIGPGQVLDRDSLVAIPAGFAKIIICNNQDNLFVLLSELKESLDDPSLDIKLSAKAFLTVGHEVLKGVSLMNEAVHRVLFNRELSAVMIDKTQLIKKGMSKYDVYNCIMGGEILQICIYASKGKASRKCLVGYVTIDLSQLRRGTCCSTEAWYKIFPSSSYVPGFPVSGLSETRCNTRRHSTSVAPMSTISPAFLALLMSTTPQRQSLSASLFRFFGEESFPSDASKRDSIETLSEVSINNEPAEEEEEEEIEDDVSDCSSRTQSIYSSSNDSCNNNFVLRDTPNYYNSDSQIHFGSRRTSKSLPSPRQENKKQKRFSRQFRRKSTMNIQTSNVKRCEEVICDESAHDGYNEEECCAVCAADILDLSIECKNDEAEKPTFIEPYLNHTKSSHTKAPETHCDVVIKPLVDENISLSLKSTSPKKVSYFRSWAQNLSNKLKSSLHPISHESIPKAEKKIQRKSVSSIFDSDVDDQENDNAYKVLKFVQTLQKPSRPQTVATSNATNASRRLNSKASPVRSVSVTSESIDSARNSSAVSDAEQ